MALSENARQVIAQTITRSAFAIPVNFPEGGIASMTAAIERGLEEAGLVVVRRDDLEAVGWNETQDSRDSDN
jgi:hypothetical protein